MIKYYLFLFSTIAMSSLFSANLETELVIALNHEKQTIKELFEAIKDCKLSIKNWGETIKAENNEAAIFFDKQISRSLSNFQKRTHEAILDSARAILSQREELALIKNISKENENLLETYRQNFIKLNEKCENLIQSAFFSIEDAKKLNLLQNYIDEMEQIQREPHTIKFQKITLKDKEQLIIRIKNDFEKNIQKLTIFGQTIDEKIKTRQQEEAERKKATLLFKICDNVTSAALCTYESAYNVTSHLYNILPQKETLYKTITQQLPTSLVQKSEPIAIPSREETDPILSRSGGNESLGSDIIEIYRELTPTNEFTITADNTELTILSFDPEEIVK